ncbi:hypothetical protein K8352_13425 [Flavobacteriaceae bacterium F89]|uniref:Long-chain fatty acid transport protein n=1 Tax=Cerina litoralis TaxID=2874477 RepID=A0AAE3EVL0_9FLAO|nr:hypothetical protein [Cerina litoralis]MCG2461753.1 hypothetical protein [Cerina litoralis]
MIKKYVIAILCCTAFGVHAQNGTISPYSYFGIGDFRNQSSVENQMMGGISVLSDSIHLNFRNPASYSKLALTTYTMSLSNENLFLKTYDQYQSSAFTNLDYLAIGIPLSKGLGAGFGAMPVSSKGYKVASSGTVPQGELGELKNTFGGTGGISKIFMSVGYDIIPNLGLGITANYNFGNLETQVFQLVENVQYGVFDRRYSRVTGFDFNYGAQYTTTIKDRFTFYSSLDVHTQSNLVSVNRQEVGSYSLSTGQDIEVVNVDLAAKGMDRTAVKIPTTTTLGVGIGQDNRWFLGAEYSFQDMGKLRNDFGDLPDDISYGKAPNFALGGYVIPDYNSFTSYLKRVTYRAGLHITKTGMIINEKEINDFGITFGAGLPLVNSFSNINLGFEVGRQGTTDAGLVEETYFKVSLGLSLNDKWFKKRKIN